MAATRSMHSSRGCAHYHKGGSVLLWRYIVLSTHLRCYMSRYGDSRKYVCRQGGRYYWHGLSPTRRRRIVRKLLGPPDSRAKYLERNSSRAMERSSVLSPERRKEGDGKLLSHGECYCRNSFCVDQHQRRTLSQRQHCALRCPLLCYYP